VSHLDRRKAVGLLVFVAVLWSTGGLLIKCVDWHPLAIAGARSALAAVVALVCLRRPSFTWSSLQIAAAVAYAATVVLFVLATKLTTAANAILLQYTAPIQAAIFSWWFLRERVTWRDLVSLAAVLIGIGLFFCGQLTVREVWGNLVALASGVGYGWLALLLRKQKSGGALESVVLGNVLAAAIGVPFMFGSVPSASSVVGLVVLGVVQLGIPYVLYTIASKHVSALDLTLIPAIEPILNPIWVLLLVGEVPTGWAVLGGAIVLSSVTFRGLSAGGGDESSPPK